MLLFFAAASGINALLLNKRRIRSIAEWQAWTSRAGLSLSGSYPAFRAEGKLEGIDVLVDHTVSIGAKGARSYTMYAEAIPRRSIEGVSVTRVGGLTALWRSLRRGLAGPGTSGGDGKLSLSAVAAEAGSLSETHVEEGSLSVPGEDAPPPAPLPPPLPPLPPAIRTEDFEQHFNVSPREAIARLPASVRRALLDAGGEAFIAGGAVRCTKPEAISAAGAERLLRVLVRIARELEGGGEDA